jgi:hypothetical protein
MPHIVLTEEQAKILQQTTLAVEIRDEQGRVLARIPPPTEEEIIERIKRNRGADLPRSPGRNIHARLQKLEEMSQHESLDEARVRELLRQMRAEEGE